MEQFNHTKLTGESPQQSAGIVGFDVLRTIIAARQAMCPTVRALAAHRPDLWARPSAQMSDSLIDMFARGGVVDRPGSFVRDEAVIRQDERHA